MARAVRMMLRQFIQSQAHFFTSPSTTINTPQSNNNPHIPASFFFDVCVAMVVGIEPRRADSVVGALPLPGVHNETLPPTWLRLRPGKLPFPKDGRMCANSGGRPAEAAKRWKAAVAVEEL